MIQYRALAFVLMMITPLLLRFAIMADYVARYDYYATVLCENQDRPELSCNGKCAMMENLRETENQDQPQAPSMPQFRQQEMPSELPIGELSLQFFGRATRVALVPLKLIIPEPLIVVEVKPPAVHVS
jgi:hypothetical protein